MATGSAAILDDEDATPQKRTESSYKPAGSRVDVLKELFEQGRT